MPSLLQAGISSLEQMYAFAGTIAVIRFSWAGEDLTALRERALWWMRAETLIITDPHFGKAATFRHHGIPIPGGTTASDLLRLDAALQRTSACRLIILGDFFHARQGRSPETLEIIRQWRDKRSELEILLVPGNHDRHAGAPPVEWNITTVPREFCEGPFCFVHHPLEREGVFALSGHIHPAISLRDIDGATLKSPCFWFSERQGLLPAFGEFTGTWVVDPQPGDHVFAVGPGAIMDVSRYSRGRV